MRAPRHTKADLTAVPASPAEKPTGRASTRSKRTPELEVVFGVRIRAARIAARMSQGDLGAALGVSFQQVQKYENGKDRIAASTMQRIAAALGVHPGSFFGDDMPAPSGSISDVKAAMRIANRIQRVRSPDVIKRFMALVDLLAEEAEAGPSVEDGTESP